ncbi:MAG: hypothetical protein ABIH25_04700 [Candidatus Woesearchaeota archaeon]
MRKIKADLHNHLGSGNNESVRNIDRYGFDNIALRAHSRLGDGGIVGITNFDDNRYEYFVNSEFENYERVDFGNGIYVPKLDLIFVRGEEVPIKEDGYEVHLLALGTRQGTNIRAFGCLEDTLKEMEDKDAIIVADHPMYKLGILLALKNDTIRLEKTLARLDAVEVHNGISVLPIPGCMSFRANQNAQKFYDKVKENFPDLGALINTDGHSVNEIGTSFTFLNMIDNYAEFNNCDQFNKHLRKAIHNSRIPLGRKYSSYIGALKHMIGVVREDGPIGMVKRYFTKND